MITETINTNKALFRNLGLLVGLFGLIFSFLAFTTPSQVRAQDADPPPGNDEQINYCKTHPDEERCKQVDLKDNPIFGWLMLAINFLSGGVILIVSIVIVMGGIQYTTAAGNPQIIQAAKNKISNAVIALFLYFFMYSIAQWLIPGGIF